MNKKTIRVIITLALLAVVWILGMLVIIKLPLLGRYGFIGLIGGAGSFVVSIIALILVDNVRQNRDTTEIDALPYIVTGIYIAFSVICNTVFCMLYFKNLHMMVPIAIDVAILVFYAIVMIFTMSYRDRVQDTSIEMRNKTAAVTSFRSLATGVMAETVDPAEKEAMRELCELISFSPNMSQSFNQNLETKFRTQMDEIRTMIESNADPAVVVLKIHEAAGTIKIMNSMNGSIR